MMCQYDEKDAIGRRYRRQDAIGTPYCITIDFETLENHTVTIRNRDTLSGKVKISDIKSNLADKVSIDRLFD